MGLLGEVVTGLVAMGGATLILAYAFDVVPLGEAILNLGGLISGVRSGLAARSYERTGTLFAPIVTHAVYNAVVLLPVLLG